MFHGSLVALVTPMQDNGDLDIEALRKLVEFHIENGTDGIVVVGTTGEAATLSVEEQRIVIRNAEEQVNGRVPLIAGTGAQSTKKAIALTEAAMHEGVDACLIMTPAYIKPTQEGLYLHYKTIAAAVGVPQILYNVPPRTCVDLLPETVERLSTVSNIVGIKEATGSVERAEDILKRCEGRFDVFSGEDNTAMELMFAGAKGVISITANVAPKMMHDLCVAAIEGDRDAAIAINNKLKPLHKNLFIETNPIPAKWAVSELGLMGKGIRLPMTVLSEQYHQVVRDAMQSISS